ncbi:TetR/AcrR family transcriptional regulator [Pseudonocardia ailaonensis]|uniref:TetR/AcrR family transcriptional regulator n=1 Tax=Pseudonocardia ailaonensis TaxID=367279 RepID=A0ABN2NLX8_9PSEU
MIEEKRLRADARRNRDRLVEVAVEAFSRPDGDVTLEAIAKAAGVGIGTLYRHFPTREALVEAAYRSEVARLCDAVPGLLESYAPDKAMRIWMDRFVDYMTAKRGMADTLRAIVASGGNPFAETKARMREAAGSLVSAGAEAGTLRGDVDPQDVIAALVGVTLSAGGPEQRDQAGRLLDLIMDGLRAR